MTADSRLSPFPFSFGEIVFAVLITLRSSMRHIVTDPKIFEH